MRAVVAVVIPCYAVTETILEVIAAIGPDVQQIYVVDDHCPYQTGLFVERHCSDTRVQVLKHEFNRGVGGAVKTGYLAAMSTGAQVIVKIDGDGQMDPGLLQGFVAPILAGEADYTKGNRFFDLEDVKQMPKTRLYGNALLSLLTKLSSGYWDVFDPTNGYTAIHVDALRRLPFHKISDRYFFESDMLFRLGTLRAVVIDVPMVAVYQDETSHLVIWKIIPEFLLRHLRNYHKRIFYSYYLRDMSLASLELPFGTLLLVFGLLFGARTWISNALTGTVTPAGTVMLAALPIIVGIQSLFAFIGHDVGSVPRRAIHRETNRRRSHTGTKVAHRTTDPAPVPRSALSGKEQS